MVPIRVASTAVVPAIIRLLPSASSRNVLLKVRPYQTVAQHSKDAAWRPALKLNSTISAIGA